MWKYLFFITKIFLIIVLSLFTYVLDNIQKGEDITNLSKITTFIKILSVVAWSLLLIPVVLYVRYGKV